MNKRKPIIGITMGDAAGVGPEVIAGALKDVMLLDICVPVVIGETSVMERAMKLADNRNELHNIEAFDLQLMQPGKAYLLDLHNLSGEDAVCGRLNAGCGRAAVEYILEAARLAMERQIDAMATAPINKEAARLAGRGELGHLELLAHYTNSTDFATMLVSRNLRVVHLTTHYALREALDKVKSRYILERLCLIQRSFRQWGYTDPIIGVAALNPHGGEGGIIGKEEMDEIIPAVKAAAAEGIDARGPFPADTIFNRAIKGEFDVVLAMYHDQGHIPIKVFNVEESISIALGLPFVRTSVDHGTAFDIAWKGQGDSRSMLAAIRAAVKLAAQKRL